MLYVTTSIIFALSLACYELYITYKNHAAMSAELIKLYKKYIIIRNDEIKMWKELNEKLVIENQALRKNHEGPMS